MIERICPVCGKMYKTYKNRNIRSCSMECYAKSKLNYKTCAICGKSFQCAVSNMSKCCSKKCSAENRRRQKYVLDSLEKAHKGYGKSDICQPNENFFGARLWKIQSPEGEVYEFRNLMNFIREHGNLFKDSTIKQAWDGISKLKYSAQGKRKRPSYSYKGWKLLKWGD